MHEWEYAIYPLDENLANQLSVLGEDGWELVQIWPRNPDDTVLIFKRPKQDDAD